MGYCGVQGPSYEYEYCSCPTDTENLQSLCKGHCNNDPQCKGYYHNTDTDSECIFATTSDCPGDCKKHHEGYEGAIYNYVQSHYSGGHIIIDGIRNSLNLESNTRNNQIFRQLIWTCV